MSGNSGYDVLVTGACGFLGTQIVAAATAKNLRVLATDRENADASRLRALVPHCHLQPLDITDTPETLRRAIDGVRAVVHCAAYGVDYRQSDIELALRINVRASVQLLAASASAGARFVHIGTAFEYGRSDDDQTEEMRLEPRGVYGVTKAAGTLAVLDKAATLNADAVVLRPFGMYGPLEGEHKLVPLVMRSMLEKRPLDLTAGEQIRDYVYVGNVAGACIAAVTTENFPSGRIINLGSGKGVSLREFVIAAANAVGGNLSLLRWGARPYRPDEVFRVVGTCERARELLGWEPSTSLDQGMAETARLELLRPITG